MNKLYPLLLEHRLPVPLRYGIAAAIMMICAILQMALQTLTGYPSYFLLLPGIFLSGLVFNRGTGLAAAAIAACVSIYMGYRSGIGSVYLPEDGLFIVTAAGTALVAEFLRAEMKRVMHADKTKSVLLQEMAHRTKNNLAVLSAMIRLQARSAEPAVASALEATARRIHVTAQVYDHLSLKQDSRLVGMRYFLSGVVEKIFLSLAPPGPIAFEVVSDDVDLPHNQALAIGIITNELVTNTLKYAFPDSRPGQVRIELSVKRDIELTVVDNGVGHDGDGDPSGLGSRIAMLLTQQLGGKMSYARLQPGLSAQLRAPRRSSRDG
ncbi:sensor histidine kinase [Bradyrhizobium sp.]|uniref:sensor histidine kinase n=1 Tax=Bradyrhizobium sp. TaxID=376 RepID=UPI00261C4992|nr:sensor histidine kinase [Bradyrhizobium sp.]